MQEKGGQEEENEEGGGLEERNIFLEDRNELQTAYQQEVPQELFFFTVKLWGFLVIVVQK